MTDKTNAERFADLVAPLFTQPTDLFPAPAEDDPTEEDA